MDHFLRSEPCLVSGTASDHSVAYAVMRKERVIMEMSEQAFAGRLADPNSVSSRKEKMNESCPRLQECRTPLTFAPRLSGLSCKRHLRF